MSHADAPSRHTQPGASSGNIVLQQLQLQLQRQQAQAAGQPAAAIAPQQHQRPITVYDAYFNKLFKMNGETKDHETCLHKDNVRKWSLEDLRLHHFWRHFARAKKDKEQAERFHADKTLVPSNKDSEQFGEDVSFL